MVSDTANCKAPDHSSGKGRLPVVAEPPKRELPQVELTEEMRQARRSMKNAGKNMRPSREQQFRIKEAKARKRFRGEYGFAKKLRDSYK